MEGNGVSRELTASREGPTPDLRLQLRYGHFLLFHKRRFVCAGDSDVSLGCPRCVSFVGFGRPNFTSQLLGRGVRFRYVAQTRPRDYACLERTSAKLSKESQTPTICRVPNRRRHFRAELSALVRLWPTVRLDRVCGMRGPLPIWTVCALIRSLSLQERQFVGFGDLQRFGAAKSENHVQVKIRDTTQSVSCYKRPNVVAGPVSLPEAVHIDLTISSLQFLDNRDFVLNLVQ